MKRMSTHGKGIQYESGVPGSGGGSTTLRPPVSTIYHKVWTDSDKKWGLNPPGEVRIGSPVLSAGI